MPLGVVGIIYESRPNVTVDTVALTIEDWQCDCVTGRQRGPIQSNQRLVEILNSVKGIPDGAIELLDSTTRVSCS